MGRSHFFALLTFLSISSLNAKEFPAKFEGILGAVKQEINNENETGYPFLPEEPIIVEIGAYEGKGTRELAEAFPLGQVFAFEPNPRAYAAMVSLTEDLPNVTLINTAVSMTNGTSLLHVSRGIYNNDPSQEYASSLLEEHQSASTAFKGLTFDVPCVVLESWCIEHQIERIDLLRLDVEGLELQILKSSPHILQTISVIVTKTHFYPFRKFTSLYADLKKFLEAAGFVQISHWYHEDLQGEAVFIRKNLYDQQFTP